MLVSPDRGHAEAVLDGIAWAADLLGVPVVGGHLTLGHPAALSASCTGTCSATAAGVRERARATAARRIRARRPVPERSARLLHVAARSRARAPARGDDTGRRSLDVLSKATGFTVADATEHAFDEYWVTTPQWQDALRYAVTTQPATLAKLSPPARTLVDRILGFDGQARADSAAALNFLFWRAEAGELLYARPEFAALREFPWPRAKFTPAFAAALLEEAEQAAVAQIKAAGDIDQPLGTMFRIAFGKADEPLGGTSIHANGRPDRSARIVPDFDSTLRAFESRPDKDGRMRAYRGSQGMRLVVFGPTAQSWSLRAFGQQMDPAGPHAADQVSLISRRQFKPMLLDRDELLKNLESTNTLDVPALP